MIKYPVKKPEIVDAIGAIDSSRVVQVVNEDYNQIIWHNGNPNNITTDQIKTKLAELTTTYDGQKYQNSRANEYPSLEEQLDLLYHDIARDEFGKSSGEWAKAIKAVKDKYPKS